MSATQKTAGLLIAVLIVMALSTVSALAIPTQWMVTGYVQGRYTDTLGDPGNLTEPANFFDAKRAFILVHAQLDKHVGAQMMIAGYYPVAGAEAGTTLQQQGPIIQEAYAEYVSNCFKGAIGLVRIPFGYETPLSSSKLITTERSDVIQTLFYPYGFDRGVFAYYLPSKGVNASFGVTNGEPQVDSGTTTTKKNSMGRLGFIIPTGQVGVSYYIGHNPAINLDADMYNFIAADVESTCGPILVISEWVKGTYGFSATTNHINTSGGYVTLAYQCATTSPWQFYYRYDNFDPDTGNNLVVDPDANSDAFHRDTVGINYFLNPTSKLQLEYQAIFDQTQPHLHGEVITQYQVIF